MLRSHRQGGTATGNVLVGCASTEALSLAHRWPLLAAGQDPASLEARVAYHLRRLGIRWRDLRATALMPRDENAKLVQGRLALSQALVLELAAPSPTIRALTPASPTRGPKPGPFTAPAHATAGTCGSERRQAGSVPASVYALRRPSWASNPPRSPTRLWIPNGAWS